MKKGLLLFISAMLLSATSLFATQTSVTDKTQSRTPNTTMQSDHNNFYNMGRGIVNVGTCWMEVFRCMVYRNSEVAFWGLIAGSIEGAGLTGMRAFGGITDFIFLGFDIGSIYNDQFQEFVWNSKWVPQSSLQNAKQVAKL